MKKRKNFYCNVEVGMVPALVVITVLMIFFKNLQGIFYQFGQFMYVFINAAYLPVFIALFTYIVECTGIRSTMSLGLVLWDRNPDAKEPLWISDDPNGPAEHAFLELRNEGSECPMEFMVRITAGDKEKLYRLPKGIPAGGKVLLCANVKVSDIDRVDVGCRFIAGWSFSTFSGEKSKKGACTVLASYENSSEELWPDKKDKHGIACHWGYTGD